MSYGLYIHLPFCRRKCPYCGFASTADAGDIMETYAEAAAVELRRCRSGVFSGNPQTIYIGGGTPSIVPASLIGEIIEGMTVDDAEFTVEANPDSISSEWLDGMLDAGANRLSIGVQSLDDRLLAVLGRLHTTDQAVRSVEIARSAGFKNISVDLMFGIPGQTSGQWERTLHGVLQLGIEHISTYSLGVEEDTPYFELLKQGGLDIPDSSETADMYVMMAGMLERSGFMRYEISNFARPGFECRHNKSYWNFTPYLGIGAGAHSFDGDLRRWNVREPGTYCSMIGEGREPVEGSELLDRRKRSLEYLMLALRTVEGLPPGAFLARDSADGSGISRKMETFIEKGFLEILGSGNVALTVRGVMLADEILGELAAELPEDEKTHKSS